MEIYGITGHLLKNPSQPWIYCNPSVARPPVINHIFRSGANARLTQCWFCCNLPSEIHMYPFAYFLCRLFPERLSSSPNVQWRHLRRSIHEYCSHAKFNTLLNIILRGAVTLLLPKSAAITGDGHVGWGTSHLDTGWGMEARVSMSI